MTDVAAIKELYEIFDKKKWHVNFGNTTVYKNFCNLLANLSDEQRSLMVDLTRRYTWITENDYIRILKKILENIDPIKIRAFKRIILFPVMKPEHQDDTKSGHQVLYTLKAYHHLIENYDHVEYKIIETYEEIQDPSFNFRATDHIFLLDDYLGSGETVEATVNEILVNPKIKKDQISVVSLVSQEDSASYLKTKKIDLFTDQLYKRGITDFYTDPDLKDNTMLMTEIEKLIPGNHFPFGYRDSEALITMIRTPDNTFPIFWKQHKKGSNKFDAPFARHD